MLKFLILAPDYRTNSAGVMCLHKLCHKINTSKHQATVISSVRNPNYLYDDMDFNLDKKDVILISCDTDYTKFMAPKYKLSVRWFLNYPKFFGVGDADFDHDHVLFTYHKKFFTVYNCPEFYLDVSKDLFSYNGEEKNIETCYYIGKGRQDCNVDGKLITLTDPPTKEKLINLLKHTKTLYSFDENTAVNYEAWLSNCDVFVRKNEQWTNLIVEQKEETPMDYLYSQIYLKLQ
jgi:hypothetical protein